MELAKAFELKGFYQGHLFVSFFFIIKCEAPTPASQWTVGIIFYVTWLTNFHTYEILDNSTLISKWDFPDSISFLYTVSTHLLIAIADNSTSIYRTKYLPRNKATRPDLANITTTPAISIWFNRLRTKWCGEVIGVCSKLLVSSNSVRQGRFGSNQEK